MSETERDIAGAGRDEAEMSATEMIDSAMRRLGTAVVIAGAVIALAVYWRPGPPRYQAITWGADIVRVDTRTGTLIACDGRQTCAVVLRHGQHVTRQAQAPAFPGSAAPAAIPPPAAPAAGK